MKYKLIGIFFILSESPPLILLYSEVVKVHL